MNCWKTINISRDYGTLRLIMFSSSTVLLSFLFYYLVMSTIVQTTEFTQFGFVTVVLSLFGLVLTHKLLHFLPIWLFGGRAKIKISTRKLLFPLMDIKLREPLSRNVYLLALFSPLVFITTAGAVGSIMWPQFLPYFSILTSINFGLAFYDLVYASHLMKAPKQCYIEDHDEGFHILIKQAV
ncbi:hypothetical protein BTR22_11430 [Alkalihalophilus pseudofirmus]|uniref:DUF3267 domain-containing protein n=1 Tax=Alkalihalophilus pseudofirmus TaxID=79885 RepID=UPI000951464A|nr:hypothetical protein BTR22_11430 [Alkalihalophilus pseudofirmus]